MAENILGGGYLPPAKPFNVINPSGVSSESALDTLLAVGEGRRNRAHQARQSAAAMEFQQREAERERMFQGQQTQASQQFAEQQRLKSVQSEEYFRTREERFALMMKDADDESAAIDFEIEQLNRKGMFEAAAELKKRQAPLIQQIKEAQDRHTRLTLLAEGWRGTFNTDATTADGKNVGAQFLRNLSSLSVSKAEHFARMQNELRGSLNRLREGQGMIASKRSDELKVSAQKRFGGSREGAPSQVGNDLSGYTYGAASSSTPVQDPEQAGPPKPSWDELSSEAKVGMIGGRWTDLAQAIASSSVGENNRDLHQSAVGVEVLLNTLEQAHVSAPEQSGYYMQEAIEQYKNLVASGLDQDHLDKALYAVATEVATAGHSLNKIQGQATTDGEGKLGVTPEVGVANDLVLLSSMLDRFQRQVIMDENGKPTKLLKGFGESEFFDFATGEAKDHFGPMITEVFQTLTNSADPGELIFRLTNEDKTDDPQSLNVINKLHPDVRELLLKDLKRARQQIEDLKSLNQITPEDGNIADIPKVKKQIDDLLHEKDVTLPNEITQYRVDDTDELRQTYLDRKKEAGKKRKGDVSKLDKELESARERMLQ